MPATPKRTTIKNFSGLKDNVDPSDLDPGASQVQVNLTCRVEGLLSSRKGFRVANSDSQTLITSLAADA
jgi:hypothetical protein